MSWPKDDPHCGTCGEQIPCSCDPCDIGQCDHKAHCDVCGKGVDLELEDGICLERSIEWLAKRQLKVDHWEERDLARTWAKHHTRLKDTGGEGEGACHDDD